MDQDTLYLSAGLGVLGLGILALCIDLLAGRRRRTAPATGPQDDLHAFLRAAPPMPVEATPRPVPPAEPPAPEPEAQPAPETGFVFRRHAARAAMPPQASTAPRLAGMDLTSIQNEIRAALDSLAASPPPSPAAQGAQLVWAEPGRLAVLSLGQAEPEDGLALLREAGIVALIAAQGHPFSAPGALEILTLPSSADAAAPLAATLRSRLAAGEKLAFFTDETGLSGAAATLAARLSSRRAG
nr:hypothetical protein [uncultured Acidocella sp.]